MCSPPHDPRHVPSSRSTLPLCIKFKEEATLLSTEAWGHAPGTVMVFDTLWPHLIDFIYLNPLAPSVAFAARAGKEGPQYLTFRGNAAPLVAGSGTEPLVLFDSSLVPFNYVGTETGRKLIPCKALKEEVNKTIPRPGPPTRTEMDQLSIAAAAAVSMRTFPRRLTCSECKGRIVSGQTICLSCGGKLKYGPVQLEVSDDEEEADAPTVVAPNTRASTSGGSAPREVKAVEGHKVSAGKTLLKGRTRTAEERKYEMNMQVARFGTGVRVKTEWRAIRRTLRELYNFRQKWDRNYEELSALGHWRDFQVALCKPWSASAATEAPPPECMYEKLDPHVVGKIAATDYIEEHWAELGYRNEWPKHHVDKIMSIVRGEWFAHIPPVFEHETRRKREARIREIMMLSDIDPDVNHTLFEHMLRILAEREAEGLPELDIREIIAKAREAKGAGKGYRSYHSESAASAYMGCLCGTRAGGRGPR